MNNKKAQLLKDTLIKQAKKNIDDPDTLNHYLEKIEQMTDTGITNLAIRRMQDDVKHIDSIFKAMEPLFNLVTSILQVMEESSPRLFKKAINDLTDGVKFTIGGRHTLSEEDSMSDVLKCIFNDAFYSMMKEARTSVGMLENGIDTIDMLTNVTDEEYERLTKKIAKEKFPEDIKEEVDKATERIRKSKKKGGVSAEA